MTLEAITVATNYVDTFVITGRSLLIQGSSIGKTMDGIGRATVVISPGIGSNIAAQQLLVIRETASPYKIHFEGQIISVETEDVGNLPRLTLTCASASLVLSEALAVAKSYVAQTDQDIITDIMAQAGVAGAGYRDVQGNATNSFTYSEDFSDATWTNTRCSVAAAPGSASEPTYSTVGAGVTEITEDSTPASTHYLEHSLSGAADDTRQECSIFLSVPISPLAGGGYEPSAQPEIKQVRLEILRKDGTVGWVEWDLQYTTVLADSGDADLKFFIRNLNGTVDVGGWYRLFISVDIGAGGTTPAFRVYLMDSESITFSGAGSKTLWLFGAQWEKDANYAGVYAGTSGAAATVTNIKQVSASMDYTVPDGITVFDALRQVALYTGSHIYEQAAQLFYSDQPGSDIAAFDLVQNPATNAWTYSEELDNDVWTKTKITLSVNATSAPNGTATAEKIIEDADTNQFHQVSRAVTGADDSTQTVSVFLKAAERTRVEVGLVKKSGGNANAVQLNLTTGAFISQTGSGPYSITDAGNGYWRVSVTGNLESGGTTPIMRVIMHNGTALQYDGDGTSGVYAWGLQHTAGASTAGDYVYTETAARSGQNYQRFRTSTDAQDIQNQVTAYGGLGVNGLRLKSVASDAASTALYEAREPRPYQFDAVLSQSLLDDITASIIATKANPVLSGSAYTLVDGLDVNTTLRVTSVAHGLVSVPMIVGQVGVSVVKAGLANYSLELGPNTRKHELLLARVNASSFIGQSPSQMLGVALNGTTQYIDFPAGSIPVAIDDLNTTGLSLSFWFVKTANTGDRTLIDKDGGWYVEYLTAGDVLAFKHEAATTRFSWTNDTAIVAGKVYHVFISWNGGIDATDCTILVNGAGTTTKAAGSGARTSEGDTGLEIGRNHSTTLFDGWLRDVVLWTGPTGVTDRGLALSDPTGVAMNSIRPNARLMRLKLDDKVAGQTLGTSEIFDSWGTVTAGSGVLSPVQEEQTFFPGSA